MISSLTLVDFRNHRHARIETCGRKNIIITGPNGTGKTAILEAVSMLGGDRGLRGSPMTEIANFYGSGGFNIFANLADDTEISVFFSKDDSNRRARIDNDSAPLSDLGAHLRIVWLTPHEDRVFVDSAAGRRDFFDRLVAAFDTPHSGRAARLARLLSERGFALKSGADGNWLDALEIQIAQTAVAVAAARVRYAGEINYFLKNCAVSVSGRIESQLLDASAMDAEKSYLEYLSANRCLQGDKMIIDGAHKSDFGVFNKMLDLPANLTSTGQQKSVLMDLILAHARLVRAKTGRAALVLLDEAAAHLDEAARSRMFAELSAAEAQVWATGLDPEVFADIRGAAFFTCGCGTIYQINN
ncbi:MAG: AAA family ATPase [Rickettsiales bacterium]|jgi:DNA replication and repair protein RecF|nr:AAA family ATPase [Rickettsiales bacterium]